MIAEHVGRGTISGPLAVLLAMLLTSGLGPRPAFAAQQVDLDGRIVSVQGTEITLQSDGVVLVLQARDVDPRFLASLKPGDEVRATAFRLADGSLLVYNLYLRSDGQTAADDPNQPPQGGTD